MGSVRDCSCNFPLIRRNSRQDEFIFLRFLIRFNEQPWIFVALSLIKFKYSHQKRKWFPTFNNLKNKFQIARTSIKLIEIWKKSLYYLKKTEASNPYKKYRSLKTKIILKLFLRTFKCKSNRRQSYLFFPYCLHFVFLFSYIFLTTSNTN